VNGFFDKEDDGYNINLVACFEKIPMNAAAALRSEFGPDAPDGLTEVVGDGAAIASTEFISTHRL
jgi:hypothetical protein